MSFATLTSKLRAPIEGKVYAATIGSAAGVTIAQFLTWLLGVAIWKAPFTAEGASEALAAVPAPVNYMVVLVVATGSVAWAGYRARHTPRPDLQALPRVADENPAPDGWTTDPLLSEAE